MGIIKKKRKRPVKKKNRMFKPGRSKYIVLTVKSLVSLAVFGGLVVLVIVFLQADFFKIETVVCRQEKQPCSPKKSQLFLDFQGENIFFVNSSKIVEAAKEAYPVIKAVEVNKKLPDKILIDLLEREAVAALSADQQTWFIIDETGFVFKLKLDKPEGLPAIYWPEQSTKLELGARPADGRVEALVAVIGQLKENFIFLDKLEVNPPATISLFLKGGQTASLSAEKDLASQVDSLQFILRQSKIEGKLPKRIDLRFSKPVVRF